MFAKKLNRFCLASIYLHLESHLCGNDVIRRLGWLRLDCVGASELPCEHEDAVMIRCKHE